MAHELRALVGPGVQIIETGEAVARQTRRLLETAGLLCEGAALASAGCGADGDDGHDSDSGRGEAPNPPGTDARLRLLTTGPVDMLQAAAQRWLQVPAHCCAAVSVP